MKDYSEYLNKPGMLDFIEKSWVNDCKEIHDFHAGVINDVIKKYKIKTATEIGCGTGNIAMRIKVNIYAGFDSNQGCIELAYKKNKYNARKVFSNLDVRDENLVANYDLVFTFGFLKHFGLHEWSTIFEKVCSLGEYLVFNMPIAEKTHDDGTEFHHVWLSMGDLKRNIDDNGFEILETVQHGVEPIFICKRKEV